MDVDAPTALVGVPAAPIDEAARRTTVELVSTEEIDTLWPSGAAAVRLFERSFSDGNAMLTVDFDPDVGYRVWAPHHGRHLVGCDGKRVICAPPAGRGWWWQRLVLAQVLPLAATLQGLELFHASAVSVGDRVLGITADAGSGKTSLAVHLVDLGATFVADDVLALEVSGGRVLAHPGGRLVNVDPEQREALGVAAASQFSDLPAGKKSGYVLASTLNGPFPLGSVYFLHRAAHFTGVRITENANPRGLLGSSFLSYVGTPERLMTHLEVCGRIAETVPCFLIEAPLDVPAEELAQLVRDNEGGW
jgi:hypothetical protein